MEQPSTTSLQFTAAELAEIERRQREAGKLLARLADTETLEEQQRLAGALCPKFDNWIRGRNRIQSTPTRAIARTVAVVKPRTIATVTPRERRDGSRRHSTRGGTDDSDPDDDPDAAAEDYRLRLRKRVRYDDLWRPPDEQEQLPLFAVRKPRHISLILTDYIARLVR
jgi:hypothetical protein